MIGNLFDSLSNLVARMGFQGADKSRATKFTFDKMDDAELLDAYRGDWLSRKIVDIPAQDTTREWRAWQAKKDQVQALEDEEKRLDVPGMVTTARILARLFGGAGLVIGVAGQNTEDELDPASVGKGGLEYLMALPRQKLAPEGDKDWTPGPRYGKPLAYRITGSTGASTVYHHSRVIVFTGADIPVTETLEENGWGDSVLDAIREALVAAGTSLQAVSALLLEAKVDVVGIPRLSELVGNEKDKSALLSRFAIAGVAKSNHNTLLKDAAETWEQKQISFQQMPELLDRFMQIVSGAADIPATRLLGQSPAGLNSTGESDLVNYYDRLASEQKTKIEPTLRPLDEVVIWSALGARPKEIHYVWRPLWQMTPKQKAEVSKLKAETLQIHKNSRLLPDVALAEGLENQLVEDSVYPGLEAAMKKARDAGELAGFEEPDPLALGQVDPTTGAPAVPAGRNVRQLPTRSPRQPIPAERARAANDAAPRPLYVSRPLLNADEIITWAREQGFKTTLPADQLHVTVAYSKRALDWAAIPPDTSTLSVQRRDDHEHRDWWRWVAKLGDDGAVVLVFESQALRERWQSFIDAGASWDFDHYWPHVTLSYDAGEYLDLMAVNAYLGTLEFGPERYDVITGEDEREPVREVSTEGGTA